MKPCENMTVEELVNEYTELDITWKMIRNSDGYSGSPGEWICERWADIEYELKQRGIDLIGV